MKQDPKLLVGKAAMQSAIIYYEAKIQQAQQELDSAIANKLKWQQDLNEFDKIVDVGAIKMSPPKGR